MSNLNIKKKVSPQKNLLNIPKPLNCQFDHRDSPNNEIHTTYHFMVLLL